MPVLHTEEGTKVICCHLILMTYWQATNVFSMCKGLEVCLKVLTGSKKLPRKAETMGEPFMNSCGVENHTCSAGAGGKYLWFCTGESPAGFISHKSA